VTKRSHREPGTQRPAPRNDGGRQRGHVGTRIDIALPLQPQDEVDTIVEVRVAGSGSPTGILGDLDLLTGLTHEPKLPSEPSRLIHVLETSQN